MGTKPLIHNRLASYARQAFSKLSKTDKAEKGIYNARTITIVDVKKQIPTQTTNNTQTPISAHSSIHVTPPTPESGAIPNPENFKGNIKDHEDIVNSRKTEKDSIDITIDRLSKKSEWKLMNKTLTKRGGKTSKKGFKKIIESMKNMNFSDKRDIQRMALFAADKYDKKQFNEEQMAEYMDVFMQRFDHAKTQLQLTSARTIIHQGSTDPLAVALELIATIQERIENTFAEYSNHIKREVPVELFGWKDISYKTHADQIDNALIKAIKLEIKKLPQQGINIETTLSTIENIVNGSVKSHMANTAFPAWLKDMKKEGASFDQITTKTIQKFEDRYNSMINTFLSLGFKPTDKALNEHRALFIENITREVHTTLIQKHGITQTSETTLSHTPATESEQSTTNIVEKSSTANAENKGILDDATENTNLSHRSSIDDTSLETDMPRSILKELAEESSTTAEEWRTSGRFSKLEYDINETTDQIDVINKTTTNEQNNAKPLTQQATTPKAQKPAPNPKPAGLTLKGRTKPQTTNKTEPLRTELTDKPNAEHLEKSAETTSKTNHQFKPALKPKPILTKQPRESVNDNTLATQEAKKTDIHQAEPEFKPNTATPKTLDESIHQSTQKTEKEQRTESQQPNSRSEQKPVPPAKPKWLARGSSKETTMTTQANNGTRPSPNSKPPLPKKPDRLIQNKPKKPDIPPKPSKETLLNSQRKAFSKNTANAPIPQDNKSFSAPPQKVTADFIVAKITDQIAGQQYSHPGEVMSDMMKLAGQPAQLRKLLEQLNQAEKDGIEIKVIRGKEEFFRNELIALINNNKPDATGPDNRTGIQVKD